MTFSAICYSHKYLLIRNISGKSGETVQQCSSPLRVAFFRVSFAVEYIFRKMTLVRNIGHTIKIFISQLFVNCHAVINNSTL